MSTDWIMLIAGAVTGWTLADVVKLRRRVAVLERGLHTLRRRVAPEEFPPEPINCRCVVRPSPDIADTRPPRYWADPKPPYKIIGIPKEYECPVCGVESPTAHMTCMRAGCPDGRDPR